MRMNSLQVNFDGESAFDERMLPLVGAEGFITDLLELGAKRADSGRR